MKKSLSIIVLTMSLMMTSCYVHQYDIGDGAKKGIEKTKMNHFAINGLIPIKTSQPEDMANGAKDYTVKTRFTFVDWLLQTITYGIYTPSTTTVTK